MRIETVKAAFKKKQALKAIPGHVYRYTRPVYHYARPGAACDYENEYYICVKMYVPALGQTKLLVSLEDGNRWADPARHPNVFGPKIEKFEDVTDQVKLVVEEE